jgi:3-dehydroquinate synthase
MMKKILIPPSTEYTIGYDLLKQLQEKCSKQRAIVIADAAIKESYAADFAKAIDAELLTIPSGEKTKSEEMKQSLLGQLFQMGCDKESLIIACGGGVTTDLVGFVASLYMRGIPLILIPTTLLAIVDACIGGKTAINTCYGKNLIGTFYNPKHIFADLNVLKTLPEKEWFNGIAEILKMGLIYKPAIWESCNFQDLELIFQAIEGKVEIVTQDPTEQSLRRILNFGHTIGHALELVSDYEMSHGEAVALGCATEAHLSMQLGYLLQEDFEQIARRFTQFALELPKSYTRSKFLSALLHDKKKRHSQTRFVLIDKIGHALAFQGAYCQAVTQSQLEPTLSWMEKWKSER